MFYFYCPNCGKEEMVEKIPHGTMLNCRDGYGMPIHHYECSECHNLDAGYMRQRSASPDEKDYYRHVIEYYQDIRGIKEGI